MKYIISISIVIGLLSSCSTSKNVTDLLEHGYLGKVKSVSTLTYVDLAYQNGKWILDKEAIVTKSIDNFNEEGNIYQLEESFIRHDDGGIWEKFTTIVEFENEFKNSFKKGAVLGTQEYEQTH